MPCESRQALQGNSAASVHSVTEGGLKVLVVAMPCGSLLPPRSNMFGWTFCEPFVERAGAVVH